MKTKTARAFLASIACAAFLGLAKNAQADDGGYPWVGAMKVPNETYTWWFDENNNGVRDSGEDQDPYNFNYRNCTSYVAWRVKKDLGVTIPSAWGNATSWDDNATGKYPVVNTPEAGDVAVWDGNLGHVAFVESVNSDGSVNVSEYNWTGEGIYDRRGEAFDARKVVADHYIDLNGVGNGINGGTQPEITTNIMDRPLGVAAHADGEQDVFWRGDGGLREAWYGNDHRWHGPIIVNGGMGPLGSAPTAAVRPSNNEENVIWKGKDNHPWRAYYDGNWHGPNVVSMAVMASQPTVTAWGSELDVFYEGTDKNLYEIWQSCPTCLWNGPKWLGMGPLGSAPTAIAHANGEQDVFWRGMDGGLWETYYTPWDNKWRGPIGLGMGRLGTAPTAAWVPGKNEQDVFWMGGDSNIWQTAYIGGRWANPIFIGKGPLGGAPSAAAWGAETDIFWPGMDHNLWETAGNTFNFGNLFGLGMGPIPTS